MKKGVYYMKKDKKYIKALSSISKNENLISVTHIYSAFELQYSSPFYFDGECHTAWEMVYVIDGEIGVTADNKVHTLFKGDIIVHKPMEFHKIWTENTKDAHAFICSFDIEGKSTRKLMGGIYHLDDKQLQLMNLILDLLRSNADKLNTNYGSLIHENNKVSQLFANYLQLTLLNLSYLDKVKYVPTPCKNMLLYTEITEILENHVYDKISISEISDICNVSPSTVKSSFSLYAGCSVHKYFLNIKIRTAIELLKKGKTVNEVSDMLQFANPNYFSYVFKRETGMCASTYKK